MKSPFEQVRRLQIDAWRKAVKDPGLTNRPRFAFGPKPKKPKVKQTS